MFKFWERWSKASNGVPPAEVNLFERKYRSFTGLLHSNNRALEIIADLEHHFYEDKPFTLDHIVEQTEALSGEVLAIVEDLNALSNTVFPELFDVAEKIGVKVLSDLVRKKSLEKTALVYPLEHLSLENAAAVGGKAANLGEVCNRANLPVPPGFAVSAYACLLFLEKSGLAEYIPGQLKGLDIDDTERLMAVSERIQKRIMAAELPAELAAALTGSARELYSAFGADLRLAVRSSATSEDGEASFAGQHTTVLNVREAGLVEAYKEVVASTFSPRAIFYRRRKGYTDQDVVMSVACIAMIDAAASGVLYTVDPNDHRRAVVLISAVWGLAAHAVEGSTAADFFVLDKASGRMLQQEVVVQTTQLRADAQGGVLEIAVPEPLCRQPCLRPEQIARLLDYGCRLERHYGVALDVEWAIDDNDRLFILQARPLRRAPAYGADAAAPELSAPRHPLPGKAVLLHGGTPACEGTASGLAFVLRSDHMLHHVPEGAIVVVRETSPRYVPLMGRIQALITDVGSVTGHMASVAREFRLPTLVGTNNGTTTIAHGAEITLDATHGYVYQGRIEDLLQQKRPLNPMKNSPIYKAVQNALQRIAPLNLTDPKKENFTPAGCQTLHDIIRFAHEKAMQAMFRIGDIGADRAMAVALRIPLPLNILLIDLGGGLRPERPEKTAQPQDVTSIPLNALLAGMAHKDVDWSSHIGVAWGGFASVLAQSIIRDPLIEGRMGGPSYAVISDHYLNFSSRLGYHFTTIDSYCGPLLNDNYITFDFKGGAADIGRRSRRAGLIAEILKALEFKVDLKADMVRGTLKKYDQQRTTAKLDLLGRLLGSVRLLDMVLSTDRQIEWYAAQFLSGNYTFKCPAAQN
jgi:pyruvate, water dikinase